MKVVGFSYNPIHTETLGTMMYIDSFEELITVISSASDSGQEALQMLQYVKRITEEEYYKID